MRTYIIGILLLVLLGYSCNRRTIRMEDFEVHGLDVSHYQAHIDWQRVSDQQFHFAFVKASEGATHNDTLFCNNWEGIKNAGMRRGAYHFFRPTVPTDLQINNFVSQVQLENGDLPPVLDVEVLDGVSKTALIVGVKTWLYTIEIKYGIKPILYTNVKFYNKYLAGHFDEYPKWIARYNSKEPTLACGKNWEFWQYGDKGKIDGIRGAVDFNVFHGNLQELDQLCLQPQPIISIK